jgi:hypothetical protein
MTSTIYTRACRLDANVNCWGRAILMVWVCWSNKPPKASTSGPENNRTQTLLSRRAEHRKVGNRVAHRVEGQWSAKAWDIRNTVRGHKMVGNGRSSATAPASPKAPTFGALPPASLQSCASMRPRHTLRPVHGRSCASMRPRHTLRPVHKLPSLRSWHWFGEIAILIEGRIFKPVALTVVGQNRMQPLKALLGQSLRVEAGLIV